MKYIFKKRLFSLLTLALCLCALLSGCDNSSKPPVGDTTTAEALRT